jgi:hypothetical protein
MRTDECGQTHTDIDRITPMVTPTWQDRERRILEHIVQAWEDGRQAEVDEIAQALDLEYDKAVRVVGTLYRAGYITGVQPGIEDPDLVCMIEPTDEHDERSVSGRRLAGSCTTDCSRC